MKRRDFFKGSSAALLGGTLLSPFDSLAQQTPGLSAAAGKAKNIIFLVSDGMSIDTLNMADLLLRRKEGRASNWMSLYEQGKAKRALMDTASANSLVTDSAAASSSWGGGKRVNNGSLNTNPDGSENKPIWRKFKEAGKVAGCVTTVPVTHATPAGFCVSSKGRDDQPGIALKYLEAGYDVLLGGGLEFFSPLLRKDGQDVFRMYQQKGYRVVREKAALMDVKRLDKNPVLGVFHTDGLPYALDRSSDKDLMKEVPSLAEMTAKAIDKLSAHPEGFVLQVEGGKVDWAAHANDIGALLYDQVAFDDAVKVAVDFAEKSKDTLVIITTDHGNANPGLSSGEDINGNFDRIQKFRHTNEWILKEVTKDTAVASLIEKIEYAQGYKVSTEEARRLLAHYAKLDEQGLYNPKKLPFKELAMIQTGYTSVGWASMDHTGSYVELAMLGPGSEMLGSFVRNYELHDLMLKAGGLV